MGNRVDGTKDFEWKIQTYLIEHSSVGLLYYSRTLVKPGGISWRLQIQIPSLFADESDNITYDVQGFLFPSSRSAKYASNTPHLHQQLIT